MYFMCCCTVHFYERDMSLILHMRKTIFRLNKCPRIIELVSSTPKIPLSHSDRKTCALSTTPYCLPTVQAFSLAVATRTSLT